MPTLLVSLATLVVLLPAIYGAGELAQRCRLPVITGYVLAGILCGQYGLDIIKPEHLHALEWVEHICLSIFALAAGGELHFEELRRNQRQVLAITFGISALTWALVTATVILLAPFLHLTHRFPPREQGAIASLAGTLMIARSPASAIAVLKETDGKGPYCSLVMAVVVVKDVVVFILFAINLELCNQVMKHSKDGLNLQMVLQPFKSLLSSVCIGLGAGLLLGFLISSQGLSARLPSFKRTTPGHPSKVREGVEAGMVAVTGACVFWFAALVSADSLLACVVTGVLTTNRRVAATSRDVQEHLAGSVAQLMPYVNTAFFGLAGASLHLNAFFAMMWVAALIWVARFLAIFFGSFAGEVVGGTPPELRGRVWQGMITQAGVALGLARIASTRFPAWGPEFAALMMSIIIMNLFTGPPLFRAAVIAMGEGRSLHQSLAPEFEADGSHLSQMRTQPAGSHDGDRGSQGLTPRVGRSPSRHSLVQSPPVGTRPTGPHEV